MTEIRTHHVTENYIEYSKPIILATTTRTRCVFFPSVYQDDNGTPHLRGKFVHQKKGKAGWEDEDGQSLRDLKAGDAVKFELAHEAMNRFLNGISILLKADELPSLGDRSARIIVAQKDKAIEIDDETLREPLRRFLIFECPSVAAISPSFFGSILRKRGLAVLDCLSLEAVFRPPETLRPLTGQPFAVLV